jgi:ankyrin repeat protein
MWRTAYLDGRRDRGKGVDRDPDYSVLELAALHGRPAIVQLLLDNGVDRKTQALSKAATNGHVDVTRLLLDHPGGGNIEHMLLGIEDSEGSIKGIGRENPLLEAAANGHVPVLRLLFERGKDFKIPWTRETFALAMVDKVFEMLLLEAGIDVGAMIPSLHQCDGRLSKLCP